MRKLFRLAKLMEAFRVTRPIADVRQLLFRDIKILGYHRINNYLEMPDYPYDRSLIVNTDVFRQQIRYIKKHYHPVSLSQVISYLDGETDLPRKPVVFTFDDGFEDNYSVVFPILQEENIPGSFFVSTGYIGGENTFWFEELANIISSMREKELHIPEINQRYNLSSTECNRTEVYHRVVEGLKMIGKDKREEILSLLRTRQYDDDKHETESLSRILNWEQLREMSDNGMDIGSHTVTHSILSTLSNEQLHYELEESKRQLEANLGKPIQALSYPEGLSHAFDDGVKKVAKQAGYRVALSYIQGVNRTGALDAYALKRLRMDDKVSKEVFTLMMAVPEFFGD